MNILLLGANGRTGRQVIRIALSRGHTITALVRTADSLADVTAESPERLRVKVGNPCEAVAIEALLPKQDALISALGPRRPTTKACKVYGDSGKAIVAAMKRTPVRRVLVTSTALLFPDQAFFGRLLCRLVPATVAGAAELEGAVVASGLEWTIARTGFLNDKPNQAYAVLPDSGGTTARTGLATFLVDEVERSRHIGMAVGLASAAK